MYIIACSTCFVEVVCDKWLGWDACLHLLDCGSFLSSSLCLHVDRDRMLQATCWSAYTHDVAVHVSTDGTVCTQQRHVFRFLFKLYTVHLYP